MRPIASLIFLIPMLATSPAALASDFDVGDLNRKLSMALQEQIDRSVVAALAGQVESQLAREWTVSTTGTPPRARVDDAADPASAVGSAAPETAARPARMRCLVSTANVLECVVVSKRPAVERVAQVP